MKICTHNVIYKDKSELAYEYAYRIACARAAGVEVCVFYLENTEYVQRFNNSSRSVLKTLKKKGNVQLYIDAEALLQKTQMEAEYLYNKYNDDISGLDLTQPCFVVKI
jgi:hypothetical protein